MKKVLIITGGSKGIGNALLKTYHEQGFEVHSISRSMDESIGGAGIFQYPFDLENIPQIQNLVDSIFERYQDVAMEKITLINNAATLGKIGPLETIPFSTLQTVIDLNVAVPMILSAQFIANTQDWNCQKCILNISSGAAQKPYHGWVAYCTSKAAIEMLTKGIAKEQDGHAYPIRSIGIIPGVVATGMQEEIRKVSKEEFKSVDRFIALNENGQLSDPADIARKIFRVDHDAREENGSIVSVREN